MESISGSVWPSRDFGISLMGRKYDIDDVGSYELSELQEFKVAALRVHGLAAATEELGTPFESTLPPNSHTAAKRGLKGITSHGKKLVRSAATLLQERYGRDRLTFATLTLPSVTREESAHISANWAEVVRVFYQRLSRQLRRSGLSGEVIGVTEVQSKRLARDSVLGLHLHFVFVGRHVRGSWIISPKWVREAWASILAPYVPPSTSFNNCENLTRVKASAAAYLGKYMSKGNKCVLQLKELGFEDVLPSTWYNCTSRLRKAVLKAVIRSRQAAWVLADAIDNGEIQYFAYLCPVYIYLHDGTPLLCGWCGRLTDLGYEAVMCTKA